MPRTRLGSNGQRLLKQFEGFSPRLYDDDGKGRGHCTVGYGHLVHYGPCDASKYASEVPFIKGITSQRAQTLLAQDYAFAEDTINDLVQVPLNQNQFDALVIFAFNAGRGAFARSTLLRKLNGGDYRAIPGELAKWNRSNGKIAPGLINRRAQEGALFMKPVTQ